MKFKIDQLKICKLRWILSLFILLVTSLAYYSFFYLSREAIRYFSITIDHEIWLLSETEVRFYNTFFAFIALIMGISSAITFLIERPIAIKREQTIRTSILNDQRFLNWGFISWASKLAILFGFYFSRFQGYYDFSLFPQYAFLIILFIIVLYLQIWTSIIRFINLNKLRLFLYSGIVLVICSFLLGSINLVDYKRINEYILSKNIYYNYELIEPKSNYWNWNMDRYISNEIFIVHQKSQHTDKPIIIFDNHHIKNINEIDTLLQQWRDELPIRRKNALHVQLIINSKTKMKYVNDIKYQLALSAIGRIGYSVVPANIDGDPRRYRQCEIPTILFNYDLLPSYEYSSSIKTIEIQIINDQYKINEEFVNTNNLYDIIEKAVINNPPNLFRINYQDSTSYKQFINIYSIIYKIINELRNSYALVKYDEEYDFLDIEKRQIVRKKYPIFIEDQNYKSMFQGDSVIKQ